MAIIAKATETTKYPPISEGIHMGICIAVIDLGEQYDELYDKVSRKVLITWELTDENIMIDGESLPRNISKEFTLSLNEKSNLRKALESWRGKAFTDQEMEGFDLINILGTACQLQITHNVKGDRTYSNICNIMAMPKGIQVAAPQTDPYCFDMSEPDYEQMMNNLPEWIADKVKKSETYKKAHNTDFTDIPVEDMPF